MSSSSSSAPVSLSEGARRRKDVIHAATMVAFDAVNRDFPIADIAASFKAAVSPKELGDEVALQHAARAFVKATETQVADMLDRFVELLDVDALLSAYDARTMQAACDKAFAAFGDAATPASAALFQALAAQKQAFADKVDAEAAACEADLNAALRELAEVEAAEAAEAALCDAAAEAVVSASATFNIKEQKGEDAQ